MRWRPFDLPAKEDPLVDFVEGLHTICGAGHPSTRNGMAVHVYACNTSMDNKCMQNADGDFLIGNSTVNRAKNTEQMKQLNSSSAARNSFHHNGIR